MRSRWFVAGLLAGSCCAAPALAHEFIVYFEFNSTAFAHGDPTWPLDVMKDTACFANLPGVNRVVVEARADAAGDAAYNLDLSYRRARFVFDHLVREGVDPRKITILAAGEARPAVPTADGVPEQLNRLAVVDIGFAPQPARAPGAAVPEAVGPRCIGRTLPRLPTPPAR